MGGGSEVGQLAFEWNLCRFLIMVKLPNDISDLVFAEKELPFKPKWDDASDSRYSIITAPLTTGAVTIGGFQLRLHVSKQHAARDAMAQLEFSVSRRDCVMLWRCQWNPFETHTNKHQPSDFAFRQFVNESHQHAFYDNYHTLENRMIGHNLPAARPIKPNPTTLSDFFDYSGKCFNIKNMGIVEVPTYPEDLFWAPYHDE